MSKIAIIVDSGLNMPQNLVEGNDVFVLPLKVVYNEKVFLDGVNITAKEVCDRLEHEIPTTSLPSIGEIADMFDKVKALGFDKILCMSISAGLSGTNGAMNIVSREQTDVESYVIDTKNISVGAALLAVYARKLIVEGLELPEIVEKVKRNVENCKVFFMVDTLEYLKKGGRIGHVASFIATKLNLKPVISCNDDGTYYTVAKGRGRKSAIATMQSLAEKHANTGNEYTIALAHFSSFEDFDEFHKKVLEIIPNSSNVVTAEISPSLGIHTGPKTLGVAVFTPK